MSEPVKKSNRSPESYSPKEVPEIMRIAGETAANLPILAGIVAALCAIRLTVFAVILAMVFGYRFSIEKFNSKSFDAAVQDATERVKAAVFGATDKVKSSVANASAQVKDAVENVKQEIKAGIESWDGVEDHH